MEKGEGMALPSAKAGRIMDENRWKQIDDLVDAALDVPEAERASFVASRANGDGELQQAVAELLNAQKESDSFLQRSAMRIAADALADAETEVSAFAFINKTIATFQVEKLLGAGGMGEVYLAFDQKLKRKVALKILPPEYGSNDERVKRFEMEARAISSLNHPGIVTVFDVGIFEGVNYIATEYVEGKTLRELMGQQFKLTNILANSIQICDALSAAHESGIVHRDIKPENVMIRPDGYAKILDFGLAKLTEVGPESAAALSVTQKGTMIGTPAYMSPAQISDEKIDHRTDLWSAGVVLYEFLTGEHPFREKDRRSTFAAILNKPADLPSRLKPEIPKELDNILLRLLAKDPDSGYQSAGELRADLKGLLRQIETSDTLTQSGSGGHAGVRQEREWSLYASVAMAVFLTGFAVYYLFFTEPRSRLSKWHAANNVQITFQAGTEAYPSLSPDGRSLLYVTNTGDGDDIFLLRIGGSNAMNLTANFPTRDTMPAYSPNGDLIAFRSDRDPPGIYLMGATGENPRRLADFGFSPSWSPDGKFIAVATGHQPIPSVKTRSTIWIIDVASGEKRLLVDSYAVQPAWSPRGDRIAYWRTGDSGERVIETIPAEGGDPIVFADVGNTNWNPVWSPDGSHLYFASDRRGNMAFYRAEINLATGLAQSEAELVPTPGRYNRHIAFSATGDRMAYVQTANRANIKKVDFDPETEKARSMPEAITDGDFELTNINLSPDGKRIIARLVRKSQDDIVSLGVDGGGMLDLTNDTPFDRYPRISPDGSKILFVSDRSGSYQIWMMNVDGTGLRQISPDGEKITSMPVWSPDGMKMSFDDESAAFLVDLTEPVDFEQAMRLPATDNGGWFRVWSWSPDGRYLAGNFDSNFGPGMGYFDIEKGTYHRVTDIPGIPTWMPDSKRLIFVRARRAMIIDVQTKETRQILPEIKEDMRNISISRDGNLIIYTTNENESDIWLLDLATE